jgi:hypothetical protein
MLLSQLLVVSTLVSICRINMSSGASVTLSTLKIMETLLVGLFQKNYPSGLVIIKTGSNSQKNIGKAPKDEEGNLTEDVLSVQSSNKFSESGVNPSESPIHRSEDSFIEDEDSVVEVKRSRFSLLSSNSRKKNNSKSKFNFTKDSFSKDKDLECWATRPGKKKISFFSSSDEDDEILHIECQS